MKSYNKRYIFILFILLVSSLFAQTQHEILVNGIKATVQASSELHSKTPGKYSVANLFDDNLSTAWVEGVEGDGTGESITVTFETAVHISTIDIFNGYQKSPALYSANARVKTMTVKLDGKQYPSLSYQSVEKQTCIPINKVVKTINLSISSAVKGAKYEDLCISGLSFNGVNAEAGKTLEILNSGIPKSAYSSYVNDEGIYNVSSGSKLQLIFVPSDTALKQQTIILLDHAIAPNIFVEKLPAHSRYFSIARITVQSDYDRDTFLHFYRVENGALKNLLFFSKASIGVDGGFNYDFTVNEHLKEIRFTGTCNYNAENCPDFTEENVYTYDENTITFGSK